MDTSLVGNQVIFDDESTAEIVAVDFETGKMRLHVVTEDGSIVAYNYDEVSVVV